MACKGKLPSLDSISQGISDAIGNFSKKVSDFKIENATAAIADEVRAVIQTTVTGTIDLATGAIKTVTGGIESAVSNVVGALDSSINALKSEAESIAALINSEINCNDDASSSNADISMSRAEITKVSQDIATNSSSTEIRKASKSKSAEERAVNTKTQEACDNLTASLKKMNADTTSIATEESAQTDIYNLLA